MLRCILVAFLTLSHNYLHGFKFPRLIKPSIFSLPSTLHKEVETVQEINIDNFTIDSFHIPVLSSEIEFYEKLLVEDIDKLSIVVFTSNWCSQGNYKKYLFLIAIHC